MSDKPDPCFLCGGERTHTRTADDGDKGYDCTQCGAQTWDRGIRAAISRHRPFTADEDALIRLYATSGRYAHECATALGRSQRTISHRSCILGVRFLAYHGKFNSRSKPIPPRNPDPVRVGQHKPWLNQNMSATVSIHHDRGLDDDE